MSKVFELLDKSLVFALLVCLLGSGPLVRLAATLSMLLEECLLNRVILDGDVNLDDFKIKLLVEQFLVILCPVNGLCMEFAQPL